MADYSLVVNSQFRPFSFDEYIKPYQMYSNAYKEVEAAYDDLSVKAGALEAAAMAEPDSRAAAQYKAYANELKSQADSLAKYGLNPTMRQALLGLKRQYTNDIIPIEQAVTRRKELAEEQRKHPDRIYQEDAASTSLDFFLNNPDWNYGESIDRKDWINDASEKFKAISKTQTGPVKIKNDHDSFTQMIIQNMGVTEDDVNAAYTYNKLYGAKGSTKESEEAWNRLSEGAKTVASIGKAVLSSSGINSWGTEQQRQNLLDEIMGQSHLAIGTPIIKTQVNQKDLYDFQYTPIPVTGITDKSGNPVEAYWNPKMKVVTDKNGNIHADWDTSNFKLGSFDNSKTPKTQLEKDAETFNTLGAKAQTVQDVMNIRVGANKELKYVPLAGRVHGRYGNHGVYDFKTATNKDNTDIKGTWGWFVRDMSNMEKSDWWNQDLSYNPNNTKNGVSGKLVSVDEIGTTTDSNGDILDKSARLDLLTRIKQDMKNDVHNMGLSEEEISVYISAISNISDLKDIEDYAPNTYKFFRVTGTNVGKRRGYEDYIIFKQQEANL